mmetsp:Transcript_61176/g.193807  ORF Transcript_61176/g.193807 Transcript_61176/m.193807 type:complete len:261 (+) Transcript_61176:2-784(+)
MASMSSAIAHSTIAMTARPVSCRASIPARRVAPSCSLRSELRASAMFATSASMQRLCYSASGARQGRAASLVVKATVSTNDFKNGLNIEIDGQPYKVTEFLHVKPGKGSAFVRSKLKNYITGNSVEKTFRAGEKVNTADINTSTAQFSYIDGEDYVFMDMTSFEETRVPKDDDWAKFLKEGEDVKIQVYNGNVIGVSLPQTVTLAITETDPGIKGNTAAGGDKSATVETGAVIRVPLFIEIGDMVMVNTEESSYLSRVSK